MGNIIDSLLVLLGFEVEDSGAKEFQGDLEAVTLSIGVVAAAAAAGAAAIGLFLTQIADGLDDLSDFADAEEYSAAKLQELGYAAKLSGSDIEAVKYSLHEVNRTVGEAVLGLGRGAMTFQKLGMSAKNADGSVKSFDQILLEVSDKIQGLSRQEASALTDKLGIDESLIPLLIKGRDAIEALTEEARAFGALSDEDFETAGAFNDSLDRTKFVVQALGQTIALGLMPAMAQAADEFRAWLVLHKEIIKTNITQFVRVMSVIIGTAFEYVMRLVNAFRALISWFGQFRVVTWLAYAAIAALIGLQIYRWTQQAVLGLISMTRWFMALNFSALLIPAAIGLIILAIGLLIDEILNFQEGNESFLGDLVKEYPQLLGVIQAISDGVRSFVDWLQGMGNVLGPSIRELGNSLLNLFTTLWPAIRLVGAVIGEVVMFALPLIVGLANTIVSAISFAIQVAVLVISGLLTAFSVVVDGITSGINTVSTVLTNAANLFMSVWGAAFNWVTEKFDALVGSVRSGLKWLGGLIGLSDEASNGALSSAASQAVRVATPTSTFQSSGGLGVAAQPGSGNVVNNNQSSSVSTGDIIVQSPDPARAGQAVRDELNRMNEQAVRNGQSAVAL